MQKVYYTLLLVFTAIELFSQSHNSIDSVKYFKENWDYERSIKFYYEANQKNPKPWNLYNEAKLFFIIGEKTKGENSVDLGLSLVKSDPNQIYEAKFNDLINFQKSIKGIKNNETIPISQKEYQINYLKRKYEDLSSLIDIEKARLYEDVSKYKEALLSYKLARNYNKNIVILEKIVEMAKLIEDSHTVTKTLNELSIITGDLKYRDESNRINAQDSISRISKWKEQFDNEYQVYINAVKLFQDKKYCESQDSFKLYLVRNPGSENAILFYNESRDKCKSGSSVDNTSKELTTANKSSTFKINHKSNYIISGPDEYGIKKIKINPSLYTKKNGKVKMKELKKLSKEFISDFSNSQNIGLLYRRSDGEYHEIHFIEEDEGFTFLEEIDSNENISQSKKASGSYGGYWYTESKPFWTNILYKIKNNKLNILMYVGDQCTNGEPGFYFDLDNDQGYEKSKDIAYYVDIYDYKNYNRSSVQVKGNKIHATGFGNISDGYLRLKVPIKEVLVNDVISFGIMYGKIPTKDAAKKTNYSGSKYLKLPVRRFHSDLNSNNTMWSKENAINFIETYTIEYKVSKKPDIISNSLNEKTFIQPNKIFDGFFVKIFDNKVLMVEGVYSYAQLQYYCGIDKDTGLPKGLSNKGSAKYFRLLEIRPNDNSQIADLIDYFSESKFGTINIISDNSLSIQSNNLNILLEIVSEGSKCIFGNCTNGFGIYKFPNNHLYQGYFENGLKSGRGIYTQGLERAFFKGQWKDGEIEDGNYFAPFRMNEEYLHYIPDNITKIKNSQIEDKN